MQGSLDLKRGPIMRVALYEMAGSQRVLIVVHHLAVDMVSWRMLLEDLWKAYEQLERGEEVKLEKRPRRTRNGQRSWRSWVTGQSWSGRWSTGRESEARGWRNR